MAKILAPNKQYNGISAGIQFIDGVGECTDSHLINWFRSKGYRVEINLEEMTADELKAYAEKNDIDIGRATSQEGILKKIKE